MIFYRHGLIAEPAICPSSVRTRYSMSNAFRFCSKLNGLDHSRMIPDARSSARIRDRRPSLARGSRGWSNLWANIRSPPESLGCIDVCDHGQLFDQRPVFCFCFAQSLLGTLALCNINKKGEDRRTSGLWKGVRPIPQDFGTILVKAKSSTLPGHHACWRFHETFTMPICRPLRRAGTSISRMSHQFITSVSEQNGMPALTSLIFPSNQLRRSHPCSIDTSRNLSSLSRRVPRLFTLN